MAGKLIELDNLRHKARLTKAVDRAILENRCGQEWEDLCDMMGRAIEIYDDPSFEPEPEPEERVQ